MAKTLTEMFVDYIRERGTDPDRPNPDRPQWLTMKEIANACGLQKAQSNLVMDLWHNADIELAYAKDIPEEHLDKRPQVRSLMAAWFGDDRREQPDKIPGPWMNALKNGTDPNGGEHLSADAEYKKNLAAAQAEAADAAQAKLAALVNGGVPDASSALVLAEGPDPHTGGGQRSVLSGLQINADFSYSGADFREIMDLMGNLNTAIYHVAKVTQGVEG